MRATLAFILLCLSLTQAVAQESAALQPILRANVAPPSVTVGQKTTLMLDVLAPNYMTRPPVTPEFQISNAVTRAGSTVNLTEQVNGTTYAGVRYEFLIYPQEPGSYSLPAQNVTVTYAAEPPASREAVLVTPELSFDAIIPDAAQELDPFVAAARLAIRQQIKLSSDPLKVGDSIVRTVTVEADETPAMLLPPLLADRVAGADGYAAQPQLQDKFESRTGTLVSQRVDQVTYIMQQTGKFGLPAIDIAWWNVRDGKVEHATADAVVLNIAENPAVQSRGESGSSLSWRRIALFIVDHRWTMLLIVILASACVWFGPGVAARIRDRIRRRRDAYRRSEAFAFAKFRAAARQGDTGRTYFALLDWLGRFEPGMSLRAFAAGACDAELDVEIAAVESRLFGSGSTTSERQSLVRLAKRVAAARRQLQRTSRLRAKQSPLPATLNPGGPYAAARLRPPAR